MRMRRRKPDPMLMGEPSPSLAKINKMNQEQLLERIESLQRESMHLLNKIERLKPLLPLPVEKIDILITQLARLRMLEKVARDRLSGKQERSEQYRGGPQGPNQGGQGGGHGFGRPRRY